MQIAQKLLTALFLTPLAGAADPALLDFIMPDARVVFGVDIGRMRSSPFHGTVHQGVQGANPEIQKLMEAAGFDPLRDLEEVLFASPGLGKNPPALVVARGTFDTSKLRAFAESAGSKITDFGGVPVLSDPDKDSGAFALLDNIILAGHKEQVHAAISRRGRGMILNTEMATRIGALSKRYDAWLVSIAPLATLAAHLPADAKVEGLTTTAALRAIEQFSVGIGMSSDFKMDAEMVMTNAKTAGSLAEGIQVVLGIMQKSANEDAGILAALQNLNFGVDQNIVHIGFRVPAEEVEKTVAKALSRSGKKADTIAAARQPAPEMPAPAVEPSPVVEAPVVTAAELPAPLDTPAPPVAEAAPAPAPEIAPVAEAAPAPGAPVTAPQPAPVVRKVQGPVTRSARIPANGEILIQSSPKDMGTVVILGSKK